MELSKSSAGGINPLSGAPSPHVFSINRDLLKTDISDQAAASDDLEVIQIASTESTLDVFPALPELDSEWSAAFDIPDYLDGQSCQEDTSGPQYNTMSVQTIPQVIIDLTLDDDGDDHNDESAIWQSVESANKHFASTTTDPIKIEPVDDNHEDLLAADRNPNVTSSNFSENGGTEKLEYQVSGASDTFSLEHQNHLANMLNTFMRNSEAIRPRGVSERLQIELFTDTAAMSEHENMRCERNFEALRTQFAQKKENDGTTIQEEIAFRRAEADEQARARLYKSCRSFETQQEHQENPLFFPEENVNPELEDIEYVMAHTGTRSPSLIDMNDCEPKSRRGRPKGSKTRPSAKQVVGKSRITKPAAANWHRSNKKNDTMDIGGIRSLFDNDVIRQAGENQGREAQPNLGTGRDKRKALVALIASLPEDQQDLHRGDKNRLEKASRQFSGRGAMRTDGEKGWKLKGMKSHLHHFQMLGASWMRDRENAGKPLGGLLGDTMGFGKTIVSLANMIDGKPPSNYRNPRATLIVAPSNLVSQWLDEIKKHVEPETFKDVIVYRSQKNITCGDPVRMLGNQDVVITTYHAVLSSMPRNEPPSSLHDPRAKADWWKDHFEKQKGVLHSIKWYRIVLDEAQAIKNYKSHTSEAVRALMGKFRWCLTATPIQNSLEEFYPYMHFLREEHSGTSFELFKQNFCKRGSEKALQRLQVILGKIMLRRDHSNKLFDRPVLQLPPIAPIKTIQVQFNTVERAIYQIVRSRFMQKVKLLSVGAGAQQHYQQIFVLLLRLRQLVGHPLLIQKTLKNLMETEDLERLWALTREYKAIPVDDPQLNTNGNEETARALEAALSTTDNPTTPSVSPKATFDNKLSMEFRKYLQSLHDDGQWAKANEKSLCHACGNPPDRPYITPCLHLYCYQCLNELWYSELVQGRQRATCLDCGTTFDTSDAFQAKGFDEASSRNGTPTRRKATDSASAEETIDWFNLPGPILRSAKVKGALQQIKDWQDQDKTNKIIVFVQFRGLIRIMARVLQEEKIKHITFDGTMSFEARDETIRRFSAPDSDIAVLIAGMKVGGLGLNLTAANRVIICDLWFNESTERQAFCRAYRIGQTRDVEVVRFVVKNSIDSDLLAMQERKNREIDSVMEKRNWVKLTLSELVELFSTDKEKPDGEHGELNTQDDSEGEGFVFPDDPYDVPAQDDHMVIS